MTSGLTGERSALDSTESIIVDGANGVTRAPRLGFPDAGLSAGLGLFALVAAIALRRRLAPWWVLPALLGLASLPGLGHVLSLRADAPLHRGQLAAKIEYTIDAIQRAAPWPHPVHVAREEDDVLFPLVRYAVPTRANSAPTVIELEVAGEHLPADCRVERPAPGRVFCGDSP